LARDSQRMERILDYHCYREEEGKRHLGTLQARLNEARSRLSALRAAYQARAAGRDRKGLQHSPALVRAQAYAERLRRQVAQQEQAVQLAQQSVLGGRERLTAAAQKRVATERVVERRHQATEQRRSAQEQEDQDDRGRLRQIGEVD
jgi:flagellar export protein FliJ